MEINFNFDGKCFIAGVIAGMAATGAASPLWLIAVPFLLVGSKSEACRTRKSRIAAMAAGE